jgi:hypothetical protein
MAHGTGAHEPSLYTLIPFEDFKAVLGVDDREDKLSAFCLITATFTIEQYCKRRLFRKKHTDYLTFMGDHIFALREYPVCRVLSVHAATAGLFTFPPTEDFAEPHAVLPPSEEHAHQFACNYRAGPALRGELFETENLVDPKYYYCLPDEGISEDLPYSLVLRPPLRLSRDEMSIKVRYLAGYAPDKTPADLASACLELAAWNMSRYRGRRIGISGNVRGSGKDGEHLESSMPENVRGLLEPYRRKTI